MPAKKFNSRCFSFSIVLLLIVLSNSALAQEIEWIDQFGTSKMDDAVAVAVDAKGNVYVGGRLGGTSFIAGADAFVRKYDRKGNLIWSVQFGTPGEDNVRAIALDQKGNIYVAGNVGGALVQNFAGGDSDAFVRKFNSEGEEVWTIQFGTSGSDTVQEITLDKKGNIYIAGTVGGALEGQNFAGGFSDSFVRKLNNEGEVIWTAEFGTSGTDPAFALAVDLKENVYVGGWTQGILGDSFIGGFSDAYLRKYDKNGNAVWTKQFGTSGFDIVAGADADPEGNVYVAGGLSGDAFVRKYSTDGEELWTKQFGTPGSDRAIKIDVQPNGNAYVTGNVGGALPGQTFFGSQDVFLLKYNRNGDEILTIQFGTIGNELGNWVAVNPKGDAFVVGRTNGVLGNLNLGQYDAFVAKLKSSFPPMVAGATIGSFASENSLLILFGLISILTILALVAFGRRTK